MTDLYSGRYLWLCCHSTLSHTGQGSLTRADWVSHDSETRVNSWLVLSNISCSLITFLMQSETCPRFWVSFWGRTQRHLFPRTAPLPAETCHGAGGRQRSQRGAGGRENSGFWLARVPAATGDWCSRPPFWRVRRWRWGEGRVRPGMAAGGCGVNGSPARVRQTCLRSRVLAAKREPGSSTAARLLSSSTGAFIFRLKNRDKTCQFQQLDFFLPLNCHKK